VSDVLLILGCYLLGLFATAEYLARRADPPDGPLGCMSVLWPVILPLALGFHASEIVGRWWSRLRRLWSAR